MLAGGRSSRMGTPKALLDWHGGTLVRRVTGILQRVADPVVVVHAAGQELPTLPGVERVVDRAPDRGPIEGMAAGLRGVADRCPAVFVSGTDLPFLHPDLVRALATARAEHDVAVPVADGHVHHLCAVYGTELYVAPNDVTGQMVVLPLAREHREQLARRFPHRDPRSGRQ